MTTITLPGVSLFVEVVGHGHPLLLMHGGPGADHATLLAHEMLMGLRIKPRPETLIYGFSRLLPGWTVMERLGEIGAPTLVLAGRDDFLFPPEHQAALAAGIAHARLEIVERAGHNAPSERPAEVIRAIKDFMTG